MGFTPADYAELLGLYLGDGCISTHPRTQRLRIALDAKYKGIICESQELLERCFPENPVGHVWAHGGTMVFLSLYSSHLSCLFPQHAGGPKHKRRIKLEDWQLRLVEAAPWHFLRGCIRSDGCSFINRTGPYEYLSYDFSNKSEDILNLFTGVAESLRLRPRVNWHKGSGHVRINRRASVARMLEHVGLKQ